MSKSRGTGYIGLEVFKSKRKFSFDLTDAGANGPYIKSVLERTVEVPCATTGRVEAKTIFAACRIGHIRLRGPTTTSEVIRWEASILCRRRRNYRGCSGCVYAFLLELTTSMDTYFLVKYCQLYSVTRQNWCMMRLEKTFKVT